MFVDFNGTLIPAAEAKLSVFDGGFQHGDGLFETMRSYRARPAALSEHLQRLARGAELLQIPFDPTPDLWNERIRALLVKNEQLERDAVLRLTLSRGGDETTDLISVDPKELDPNTLLTSRDLPAALGEQQLEGVRIMTLQPSFARGNFPQLKSLNYLPSIMALRFARGSGFAEACLISRQSKLLECATSNIFLVSGGRLRTPSPRLGILPGIARARVMRVAVEMGIAVEEAASELRDLLIADEVFLSSSVKEVLPVVTVDQTTIGDGAPGPITRQLQDAFSRDVELERLRQG